MQVNMSERLTTQNFSRHREHGMVALSLVGMSNVGKSYWSRLLGRRDFEVVCCDDKIEEQLGSELHTLGYSGGIRDVARWMGQPYDQQFAKNQARYLQLETEVTTQAMEDIDEERHIGNVVVDTTGSVVHLEPALRRRIQEVTTVVYLAASEEMKTRL
jgi:dephospho-CoA kinase